MYNASNVILIAPCREDWEPIQFDDKHISEKNRQKVPVDVHKEEPHDCCYGGVIVNNSSNYSNHYNSCSSKKKDDIINVTKTVARKSILM
jgi:hypothetical protein